VQRPARPIRSTFLSFLWPGLGQWYAGRHRAALIYFLPAALLALYLLAQVVFMGADQFVAGLLDPNAALTLVILVAVLGLWRLLSIADALAASGGARALRGRVAVFVAVLGAVVLLSHGLVGYYGWSLYAADSKIFVGDVSPDGNSSFGGGPAASGDDFAVATPFATPQTASSRITILLTGIDHTTSRTESLTDTMLIVSLNPATGAVSMVSMPRDIAEFPMWNGATYRGKINSLMSYARANPKQFPDGPLPSLVHELSFLLGTPIHYYAAVDLDGFRRMVDVLGGVTVTVTRAIDDPTYDWLDGSPPGFHLSAGVHTLDSRTALAFVRSRKGAGDSDFTRAARQQQLLVALRHKLTDPAMLPQVPSLLSIAGETVRTNFPPDRIGEMLRLAQRTDDSNIERVVLQPPTYSIHPPTSSTGGSYILRLDLAAVARLSIELYGSDSTYQTTAGSQASPAP
jgi:LCP family protein required for cell wall assembly